MRLKKQEEWTPGLAVRNIVISLLILMLIFLWDNREYVFQYQFHREEYTKVEGRIWRTVPRRNSVAWVALYTADGTLKKRRVVRSFWERTDDIIPAAYSESRKPSICRVGYVLTFYLFLIFLLALEYHVIFFRSGRREIHNRNSGGGKEDE